MNIVKSCNGVRQGLVDSGLHYFINESPHSIWITIRKKFLNIENFIENLAAQETPTSEVQNLRVENKALDEAHKQIAASFASLRKQFESEIGNHIETKEANDKLNELVKKKLFLF